MNTNLINEEEVDVVLEGESHPVVREILKYAIAKARMRVMRFEDEGENEWRMRLPQAAFDMGFYLRTVLEVVSDLELLRALLDGKSLAEATGWDSPK
jgi:hypothetical protein